MRIEEVEWFQAGRWVYVLVHCEDGTIGLGEGGIHGYPEAVGGVLQAWRTYLIGKNPLQIEHHWQFLYRNSHFRGAVIGSALSAIDIALWDILGKATGQPVGRLLGGRYRERVAPYASLLMEEPVKMRDRLSEVKSQGFRAFKIGWGPFGRALDHKLDEAIVKAARDGAGPKSKLFVDAGASDAYWPHGLKWALRTAEMLKDYDVGWFEEALKPDAIDDFVELRRQSPVPIAGGEVLTRRQAFQPWLTAGAFDIVQPDVTKCGGLSEQRRIAQVQPQSFTLDQHLRQRRDVAQAQVQPLPRDRMDAVRGITDQRQPLRRDPRGMVEAQRIARARRCRGADTRAPRPCPSSAR